MKPIMDIEQAEIIVTNYGAVLSSIEPSIYGIAISKLPHEKEQIKTAIQTLLFNVNNEDEKIYEGLTQAYVYLAQFIPDEKVHIAENGRAILEADKQLSKDSNSSDNDTSDLELANQAVQTINGIKSDMENLMNEIRLLFPKS